VYYDGTVAQWNNIRKDSYNYLLTRNTATLHCLDQFVITYETGSYATAPSRRVVRASSGTTYALTAEDLPNILGTMTFKGWLLNDNMAAVGDTIESDITLIADWFAGFTDDRQAVLELATEILNKCVEYGTSKFLSQNIAEITNALNARDYSSDECADLNSMLQSCDAYITSNVNSTASMRAGMHSNIVPIVCATTQKYNITVYWDSEYQMLIFVEN
jgi:hypothetical protein